MGYYFFFSLLFCLGLVHCVHLPISRTTVRPVPNSQGRLPVNYDRSSDRLVYMLRTEGYCHAGHHVLLTVFVLAFPTCNIVLPLGAWLLSSRGVRRVTGSILCIVFTKLGVLWLGGSSVVVFFWHQGHFITTRT